MNKDIPFFDETRTGDILSRMTSDITVVQNGLSTNISMLIRSLVTIIASLLTMGYISWRLTLVTLAGIFPILLVGAIFGKYLSKISKQI